MELDACLLQSSLRCTTNHPFFEPLLLHRAELLLI